MHARHLLELAALLAANGEILMRGETRLSRSGVGEYWTASKCRLDRWARTVKSGSAQPIRSPHWASPGPRPPLRPWLEEIITGEVLTRIWTAIVCGLERRTGLVEAEPVVRSVFLGHLEARHKTLRVLVSGRGISATDVAALNRLRRRTERWNDMLLGYLLPAVEISELAFSPGRTKDFADGLHYEKKQKWGQFAWPLVFSSLRAAFHSIGDVESPNADLNGRIAASVLSCFGPDLFDSTGRFQSVWQMRLTNTTNDTMGMLSELVGEGVGPVRHGAIRDRGDV